MNIPDEGGNSRIGNFESARFLQFKSEIGNLKPEGRKMHSSWQDAITSLNHAVAALGFEISDFGFELQESCTFEISDFTIPRYRHLSRFLKNF
jgi:hypothetical protein